MNQNNDDDDYNLTAASSSDTSGSSASDNGQRVHNIQSILIKSQDSQRELDPNYAYKQRLGDLIFNANFEGGNLGHVEQIDQFDYDLMIRPDVANPRQRLWFNFTVSNQRAGQCVVFTFVNLSESLILFNEGLTPVVRSRQQPNWWRLDEDQVFYYKSASHNNRRVLSLAFKFSNDDHPGGQQQNEHQFAIFYPYTFTTLQSFINRWQVELTRRQQNYQTTGQRSKPIRGLLRRGDINKLASFKVDTLASSVLFKPIYMLTISSVESHYIDFKSFNDERPTVILFKAASGNFESVSSFVCQGYLDFMLSDDSIAQATRGQFHSIVLPMLDPDSVCSGNSRTDIFGQPTISLKLLEANPNVYENFKCALNKLTELVNKSIINDNKRVILIELRVNCNMIGARIVGSHYEDSVRMERHYHLARLLSRFADGFYLEKCNFHSPMDQQQQQQQQQHSTLFNFNQYKNVDQYVLEVSPFACYKRSLMGLAYEEYDQKRYLLLGKALAYSLLQLFRSTRAESPELFDSKSTQILDSFHLNSNDIDDLMLTDLKK